MSEAELEVRVGRLVARFDGLIKYRPMLQDHPDWTDDQYVAFAAEQHQRAVQQRVASPSGWNNGVPYCRNIWREDLV